MLHGITENGGHVYTSVAGAAQPKCGVACSKRICCGMGGQKWKNCVEPCEHKMGVKFVRVGVIWV